MPDINPSDEQRLSGLLKTQASGTAPRGWRCTSDEKLAAYIDGRLDDSQRMKVQHHLAVCDRCLRTVGWLTANRDPQTYQPVPDALLRRAVEPVPERPSRMRWHWVLAPTLAAAALVSVAVLRSPQAPPDPPVLRADLRAPDLPAPEISPMPVVHPPMRPTQAQSRAVALPSQSIELLAPRAGAAIAASGIRMEWKTVPSALYYEVHVVNAVGDLAWQRQTTQTVVRAEPNALAPGKYFYWIVAHLPEARTLKSGVLGFEVRSAE